MDAPHTASFDGVAILFGGLSGNVVPKRGAGARLAARVVLASAAGDAHHAATMAALASALTDAGHAFTWSSRSRAGHRSQRVGHESSRGLASAGA